MMDTSLQTSFLTADLQDTTFLQEFFLIKIKKIYREQ